MTELVTGARVPLPYMTYGPTHAAALREAFKTDMFTPRIGHWFYNQTSDDPDHVPDLGYYLGYAITQAFYDRAADKPAAIRTVLELPFDDDNGAVEAFLARSGYNLERLDKAALLRAYEARRPTVTRVVPVATDGTVAVGVTELRVEFSAPMARVTGIGLGAGGRPAYPITARIGFSPDRRAYRVRVAQQPGRTYTFVLEGSGDGGFSSMDGYPLHPDTVQFRTK